MVSLYLYFCCRPACVWLCLLWPPARSSCPLHPLCFYLFILFILLFFFGPWLEVGDLRVTPGLLLWLSDRLLHHLTQQRQLPRSIVLLPIPAAAAPPLITMIPWSSPALLYWAFLFFWVFPFFSSSIWARCRFDRSSMARVFSLSERLAGKQ